MTQQIISKVWNYCHTLRDDGVSYGVSDGIKHELIKIVRLLVSTPVIKAGDIAQKIDKAKPTTERYLKTLRLINLIEHKGAAKTGGYFITSSFEYKLANKQHDKTA